MFGTLVPMSIKVALEHRTTYRFAEPVTVHPHVVRLRPAPHSRTPIEAYSLDVAPANHFLNWQQDPYGNWLGRLVFPEPVSELDITVGLVADMMVVNPLDFFVEKYAERFPFSYDPALAADLGPYLVPVEETAGQGPGPLVTAFKKKLPRLPKAGKPVITFLAELNAAVRRAVEYSVRMEAGVQTPDETLKVGVGSCRDSAWLLVSLLRQYGLAARFVSGYLVQLAPDLKSLDGPSGPEQDFTDLHAWTEVYLPGAGWVGMDPTSGLFASEGHIPLSATPHPSAAAPISGATDPVEVEFSFHNVVRRIHEDPRVTKPYSDDQWWRIDSLGIAVDARLEAGDVRLTMGGEPTFVSVDDQSGAEWNTDADGFHKRALATDLADRLRGIYAQGGAIYRGQGKWYPGEDLPRWQIALQWRTDNVFLWQDPTLFADPWDAASADHRGATKRAEDLAHRITELLGLPRRALLAAWEDPLEEAAAEIRQPAGRRPKHLDEFLDKQQIARLDRTESHPTGWVLPLVPGEEWTSPQWRFRRGRLVLTPGTSPLGLRLPLDSIAWESPQAEADPDYLVAGPPLHPDIPTVTVVPAKGARTTALGVEARGGHVHVFLPPTKRLEEYTDLLYLLERAAGEVEVPIVLEGYGPPPDPRLTQLVVTPDPGVIEVNVQPSHTWSELRELTTTLYDVARRTRLTTEKFDLDGLHTGTGGGNHITLGGHQPADSPLLRRPDLLASLVRYWQRHPSLSYLFSGRFIGPTSQAPRFDEARPEAVYEMEIALAELQRMSDFAASIGEDTRPWVVDRALRHLLVDLTGNTHRAEFCVDKLYSPDSSRGRLGLLELRGFEMPPHSQMAMVQALLVRSLVALFWEEPNTDPLVRWGTRLHDEFLLPQGNRADIAEVVADLNRAGIWFEEAWLDPFFEFRFPRIGFLDAGGVNLELRQAIEPWHVLGEEATGSGTSRYVDSSVERVQVLVRGLEEGRHLVTCQGVPVPLTPTPNPGEFYAGVRYRAWQPWSALHPSIPVHAPLHFDVVDVPSHSSLGGATYHVAHPGGRSYDVPPVNAMEAESRRHGRFDAHGMTAGYVDVGAAIATARRVRTPEYPRTLDLRRVTASNGMW